MQTPKGEINDRIFDLIKDEATLDKMSKAGSPEACYELVKDKLGISFEEFQASMSIALSYVNESDEVSGELTEDELEAVAGGKASINLNPSIRPGFDPKINPVTPAVKTAVI